jgi:hypothetical protein
VRCGIFDVSIFGYIIQIIADRRLEVDALNILDLVIPYCSTLSALINYILLWTNKFGDVLEHLPKR